MFEENFIKDDGSDLILTLIVFIVGAILYNTHVIVCHLKGTFDSKLTSNNYASREETLKMTITII